MTGEEKWAWIAGMLSIVTYSAYLVIVQARAGERPFTDVHYVTPLLWTVGASIVASIVLSMVTGIDSAKGVDRKDQRDREIGRFGEYVGHWVLVVAALGAMVLALFDADTFWIANVLYLGFSLSAIVAAAAKIITYRRGFPGW